MMCRFKSSLELTEGLTLGYLRESRKGWLSSFTGNSPDLASPSQNALKADVYIATNASCIELTDIKKYVEETVKDRPFILWNMEVDTLRADLGQTSLLDCLYRRCLPMHQPHSSHMSCNGLKCCAAPAFAQRLDRLDASVISAMFVSTMCRSGPLLSGPCSGVMDFSCPLRIPKQNPIMAAEILQIDWVSLRSLLHAKPDLSLISMTGTLNSPHQILHAMVHDRNARKCCSFHAATPGDCQPGLSLLCMAHCMSLGLNCLLCINLSSTVTDLVKIAEQSSCFLATGLFSFPPKTMQHEFLSQFKPTFYIRQRDYSKVRLLQPWSIFTALVGHKRCRCSPWHLHCSAIMSTLCYSCTNTAANSGQQLI